LSSDGKHGLVWQLRLSTASIFKHRIAANMAAARQPRTLDENANVVFRAGKAHAQADIKQGKGSKRRCVSLPMLLTLVAQERYKLRFVILQGAW
jgi:hypothetical protein